MRINQHTYRSAVLASLVLIVGNLNAIQYLMTGKLQPAFVYAAASAIALGIVLNWIHDFVSGQLAESEATEA